MITVITGTPGAGKTLYTIEKLLQPLVGATITYTDSNGDEVTAPRTIYTNINGLLLDHEKIDGGDNLGLRDWHKWAKPGAVIVFDEVQRHWVPRANGSKVPDDIQALETHRHMGVDFIIITQNVLLVDRNIHALAGRHLHVRRLAGTHMAIVYEWDHVSRALLYAKSLTKSPWRYSSKVFKLYKSAEVHTKQPRKLPGAVWFILAAILGTSVLGPTVYARLNERISGGKPPAEASTPPSKIGAPSGPAPSTTPPPASPPVAPTESTTQPAAPVYSGCIASKTRCTCYDTQGNQHDTSYSACLLATAKPLDVLKGGNFPEPVPPPPPLPPPEFVPAPRDNGASLADLAAAIRRNNPQHSGMPRLGAF